MTNRLCTSIDDPSRGSQYYCRGLFQRQETKKGNMFYVNYKAGSSNPVDALRLD